MTCPLCLVACETIDHLFLGCPYTLATLLRLLPDKITPRRCPSAQGLWEVCATRGGVFWGFFFGDHCGFLVGYLA